MGTATEIAMTELASEVAHASSLRQLFLDLVVARVPSAVVNAAAPHASREI
jgi:cysteine sulfinate desulfinase/cysteine desulfurase-like protein